MVQGSVQMGELSKGRRCRNRHWKIEVDVEIRKLLAKIVLRSSGRGVKYLRMETWVYTDFRYKSRQRSRVARGAVFGKAANLGKCTLFKNGHVPQTRICLFCMIRSPTLSATRCFRAERSLSESIKEV